ncbi:RyR domain-containing protein [Streptomyces aurantiacus]|uniref:Ryanodine receptor Ryr domain-containing protein n=1 Tax=Streptomyces aurantiacus JA 4570 TaxID=1286094 RepID=S4A0G3_9ACTN|nr:RyR domain-containing protein [Streptomyces aurantiacus]EPH44185.1 hypothetical protein STRAU_2625 [Streptomyces aurantiacus JA 4570]
MGGRDGGAARRSGRRRTHPLLVPYADLTYEEQETDRLPALETVKLILLYGYTLGEPAPHLST